MEVWEMREEEPPTTRATVRLMWTAGEAEEKTTARLAWRTAAAPRQVWRSAALVCWKWKGRLETTVHQFENLAAVATEKVMEGKSAPQAEKKELEETLLATDWANWAPESVEWTGWEEERRAQRKKKTYRLCRCSTTWRAARGECLGQRTQELPGAR
jgi:hypothetical protein